MFFPVFCAPASTDAVELSFSANEVRSGKRNCLSDDNLEQDNATHKQNLFVLKFKVTLPCIFWSNFAIGIILYFGTTIELGFELKLELELEKQTASI